jgi:hypothetical protein
MADHIEILAEEPSMEQALRLIVPKIVGDLSFEVYPHLCKEDLLGKLPERLRGYAAWLPENWRIMVVVDRDDDQYTALMEQLENAAREARLTTRAQGPGGRVVNRLAIEELEAWFFGDWEAVLRAYPKVHRTVPNRAGYRDPDAIRGGTWEALERCLQRGGYFRTGLRKVEAARTIAQHMDPKKNRSASFQGFRAALTEMTL